MESFAALLADHTTRTVALGVAVLGAACGSLGCFALLRRQSLLGDAMSHAALPGVVLAFMLTGTKEPLVLLAGAAIASVLGALCVTGVTGISRIKQDTMLGVVLSVFFGGGIVLLTLIQRSPEAGKAGLDKYLFGSAATLLSGDLLVMSGIAGLALLLMLLFWPRFKLLSFDPAFMGSLGLRVGAYDVLLTALIVVAIVIGLQTVGVVLMSAMLVAPAAAARQWTDRLPVMAALAAGLGALGGVGGVLISSSISKMPTGPVIVVVLSAVVLLSLILAPERGLLAGSLRHLRTRLDARRRAVLLNLLHLAAQHDDPRYAHELSALRAFGELVTPRQLQRLADEGLVELEERRVRLSSKGLAAAQDLALDQQMGATDTAAEVLP